MENNKKDMGALWTRESKGGLQYFSGTITIPEGHKPGDKINISIFKNSYKKHDKSPDYSIKESNYSSNKSTTQEPVVEEEKEEIPF